MSCVRHFTQISPRNCKQMSHLHMSHFPTYNVTAAAMSLCLCVILWTRLRQKYSANFIECCGYDWASQLEEPINFCWCSSHGYGFRITSPFSSPFGIGDFSRFISILIQWLTDFFTKLGQMIDADKVMNPQLFESDAADIQIRLNPVIRIPIPDRSRILQRDSIHSIGYGVARCLSVRLSHAGILLKRLQISSNFLHRVAIPF